MAGLGRRGEEEHRLGVLVLHARELGLLGRVQGLLARRVGVQGLADDLYGGLDLFRVTFITGIVQQILEGIEYMHSKSIGHLGKSLKLLALYSLSQLLSLTK